MAEAIQVAIAAVLTIATLAGAIYGAALWIDSRVEKKIGDPDFVEKLAKRVRPSLVFDSDNRILADGGALELIESVTYLSVGSEEGTPEVLVIPHEFMPAAPVLESLDVEGFNIEVVRGEGIAWRYILRSNRYLASGVSVKRFRVEILR